MGTKKKISAAEGAEIGKRWMEARETMGFTEFAAQEGYHPYMLRRRLRELGFNAYRPKYTQNRRGM